MTKKLVVLIPAFNEESSISSVISKIPRKFLGIDKTIILVVNDGSTDDTYDVALNAGADKIISHRTNMGVGAAFMTGIRTAISLNADIVVTIDADSQFDPKQISDIINPVVNNQLDVVIGSRFLDSSPKNIPFIKSIGNKIFSKIVSWSIGQTLSDTQTGLRAYSTEAILSISIVNNFTYTQEVLIDLSFKGYRIGEIPIEVVYDENRKSRVVKNIFNYSSRALSIIIKSIVFHRPIFAFGLFGGFLIFLGSLAKLFTYYHIFNISAGLSTGLIILGIVSFMMGLFASVVFNRQSYTEKDIRQLIHNLKDTNIHKNPEQDNNDISN